MKDDLDYLINQLKHLSNHSSYMISYDKRTTFFGDLADLLSKDQLTVSLLTERLGQLNYDDREGIFDSDITYTEALLIKDLYFFLGVKLSYEQIKPLTRLEIPSIFLQSQLRDWHYHAWQKSPLDRPKIRRLECELKGALDLRVELNPPTFSMGIMLKPKFAVDLKGNESLVQILESLKERNEEIFIKNLKILVNRAPAYVPHLLEQMHQNLEGEDKQNFVRQLLASKDKLIIEAMLHSSSELIAQMVEENPEYFFKASKSMRTAVQNKLSVNTLKGVRRVAVQTFPKNEALKHMTQLVDGSYRHEETSDPIEKKHEQYGVQDWLQSTVREAIKVDTKELIAEDQKHQALKIIETYLYQNPGQYKARVFKMMAVEIEKKGVSIDLLNSLLSRFDNQSLFEKWSGLSKSRAAGVMAKLYQCASLGRPLTDDELQKMVNTRKLPTLSHDPDSFINNKIREVIMNPAKTNTPLTSTIGSVIDELQVKARMVIDAQNADALKLETSLQAMLISKATERKPLAIQDETEKSHSTKPR